MKEAYDNAQSALSDSDKKIAGYNASITELSKQLSSDCDLDKEAETKKKAELSEKRTADDDAAKALHTRIESNTKVLANIQAKVGDLDTLEKRYTWLKALSNTANGNISGKEKVMLETYIQMTYFDRIIARANTRFMVMSGGQYELKRRREAENNRSQSGLDLDVIDHYNGTERSVKTLSGGESFKASLSLALGLSDEIQASAGGVKLDTMFVDEGFGSLDEESLDQAMKALSSLADGNRLVGIISHVADLKNRIDKQIVVEKRSRGEARRVLYCEVRVMSFDFNIALTGIGPHSNTKLSSNMNSIQMALYADNGSGKSFISKSFKRISDLKYLDRTDQSQIDLLVEKSTAMVRFGEKQGILSLAIAPDGQPQKNLSVRFEIGSLPIVSDNTGLIYHVFNSEYVRENLEAVRYHPEDKVSGFILGKANIDLSKEKEQLENYKKAELEAIGKVRDMVASTQRELKAKGIQSNTKEYLAITFESVLRGEANSEDQSYTSLVEKYDILKSMPEHMQDISYRPFSDDIESFIAILENANEIIENKYTLSSFSEEFKKKFKDNQAFIEAGLQLSDGESCPFCGQKYNRDAFALIDDYNSFLQDEESKIIKAINGIIAKITTFSANLLTSSRFAKDSSNEYDKVKEYFPSFCETYISCVDVAITQQVLDKICEALEAKSI